MSNLNLEYQVRVEQYRDLYREAQQEQLWVRAGLASSPWQGLSQFSRRVRRAAEAVSCRLPVVQTASYCRAPTGA